MTNAPNPFRPDTSRTDSTCLKVVEGTAAAGDADEPIAGRFQHVYNQLSDHVRGDFFPCLAGRSAFRNNAYWIGVYSEMLSPDDTQWLCADLHDFVLWQNSCPSRFSTFIAAFHRPTIAGEEHWEEILWQQLKALHQIDAQHHGWDPIATADPADKEFSFSVGGRAFFLVTLHPAASRMSRRFPWPALVFNALYMFHDLYAAGEAEKFKKVVRERDMRLQGTINPNLHRAAEVSRAREYSGRAVPLDWQCPWLRGGSD